MKNLFKTMWMVLLLLAGTAQAATCISYHDGNWNGGSSVWFGCTLTSSAPPAGATVIINNLISVTANTLAMGGVTINSGGELQVASGQTLTLTGNFTNNGLFRSGTGSNNNVTPSGTVAFTGTAQTITGNTTFYKMSVGSATRLTLVGNVVVTSTMTGTPILASTCPTNYTLKYGSTTVNSCVTTCSTYKDKAYINEVRIGASRSSSASNQIEIYNSTNVASTVWKTWKLVVNYKSSSGGTPTIYTYPLSTGFVNNGQFIYNNTTKIYLRNRSGRYIDIALTDSTGNFIDYIAIGGNSAKMQTTPSCMSPTTAVASTTSGSDKSGDLPRMSDGGSWPTGITDTSSHTIGQTNSCSVGVSDLVVSNAVDILSPIVNSSAVTYTVTVLNKSCTATVTGVKVTDTNISSTNFSSLAVTPSVGSTAQSGNNWVWTVGDMAAGASATLTIVGTPKVLGALATTASVSAPTSGLSQTSDDSATATITVRDFNYVGFDLVTDSVTEGLDTTYTAYISSNLVASKPITINYTVSGTAGSGDTNLTSGSVTIDPASADMPQSARITFTIINDLIYEPTKTIILTIASNGISSDDTSVKLNPAESVMTITLFDDDMPTEVASYHLDEFSWNGTVGEVNDSSVNGFDGKAKGSTGLPRTQSTTPAMVGDPGTCRYGTFGGASTVQYVSLGAVDLGIGGSSGLSVSAWVRWGIDPATGNQWSNIVSNGNSGSGQFWIQHSQTNNHFEFAVKTSVTRSYVWSRTTPVAGQWYHVAGVYDGAGLHIYVNGVLDDSATVALTGTVTPFVSTYLLNIGIDNSFTRAFQGDIDEVRIFNGAISDSQIATIAAETHTCPVVLGPDHYEMALNSNSLTCLPSTVTVTACADTTSPCANAYTAASGSTATLTTSGATLGASTVTFNVSGVATTTLSYPTAADSTSVSVTLSGELIAATSANPRQCCPNGSSCTVTSSCSTIFKSAGFIFSSSNNGAAATIPAQVAGVGSGSYVLRAVQTNPSTMACQSALTGAQSVNFAYECTDPSTCYGANLMSVNGGTATTISRNNSGSHSSVTPVNLTFDASGNAPITFVYSDVGKVTLWASATVNSAVLTGSTSPTGGFLVKPYDLGVIPCAATVVGACTAAPSDPGLAGGGSAFATAGKAFKATITARAFGGLATPSFGSGSSNTTETVGLTVTRVAPTSAGAVDGALGGTTSSTRSNFASGILTVSDLTWSEVGVIMLTASNSTFFGSTTSTTGATGNVGRFIPDHFDTVVTGLLGCPSGLCTSPVATMAYSGQPFGVTVTAKNAGGNTTQNYQGSFAKLVTLSAVASNGGSAIATTSPGGTLSLNTIAASAFAAGVNPVTAASPVFTFATAPTAPTDVYIRAVDSDLLSSLRSPTSSSGEGGLEIVSGQLKIINNYGSELLSLPIHLVSQYWANATTRWVNSTTDNTTSFVVASPSATSAVSFSNFQKNLTTVTVSGSPVTITLAAGRGSFTLAAPGAGHNGSFDLSIPSVSCSTSPMPLGCYLPSSTGTAGISRSVFGIYKSPLIYRRENY